MKATSVSPACAFCHLSWGFQPLSPVEENNFPMPSCSTVCKGVSTSLHHILPCWYGRSLHSPRWSALSYKQATLVPCLLVLILSHPINSSSCELLNVIRLYNLPPLLHSHYRNFIATAGQSVPTLHFGLWPLGWSHCVLPLTLLCRFPSSVTKPAYKSCPL